jgi:hypothetical protein
MAGRRKLKFSEDVDSLKSCSPGPKVIFPKDEDILPAVQYLENYKKMGVFNCNPEQYPKFINSGRDNGKYCCSKDMTTDQELLDYVNMLLKGAVEHVDITEFYKHTGYIKFILEKREELLTKNLEDNFDNSIIIQEFENMFRGNDDRLLAENPNPNLDDWFRIMTNKTRAMRSQERPAPEDLDARIIFSTMTKQEKSRHNLAVIESIKNNHDGTFSLCSATGCILLAASSAIIYALVNRGGTRRRRNFKKRRTNKFATKLKK